MDAEGKWILNGTEPVRVTSLREWAEQFEIMDRHVASSHVGRFWVSTVFLGTDHRFFGEGPPILFESMVFKGNYHDLDQNRYATWAEADAGHDAMIAALIEKVSFAQLVEELESAFNESGYGGFFPVCNHLLMEGYKVRDTYRGGPWMNRYLKWLALPVVAAMGCVSVLYDKFMIRMKRHEYRVRPRLNERPEPQLAA